MVLTNIWELRTLYIFRPSDCWYRGMDVENTLECMLWFINVHLHFFTAQPPGPASRLVDSFSRVKYPILDLVCSFYHALDSKAYFLSRKINSTQKWLPRSFRADCTSGKGVCVCMPGFFDMRDFQGSCTTCFRDFPPNDLSSLIHSFFVFYWHCPE